jgi:hypothetical protein
MRSIKIFILSTFLTVTAIAVTAFIEVRPSTKVKVDNQGFAVVELFTSEGCSSCPPADELVARIQKESKDKPVYILAYHVDYWNSLGWKDVFSSADFSKRQRDYATYLHLQSVYTPQVIVNGRTEFVGSEESTLRNAIRADLQKASSAQLTLSVLKTDQNQASLKYVTAGAGKNTVLLVAVLQQSAQTKVERGENGGHTLSHVQIVRKLQRVSLTGGDGLANVTLPHGFDTKTWEIIGFLQNTSNGAVIGATRVALAE